MNKIKPIKRWLNATQSEKDFWAKKNVKAIKNAEGWERFLQNSFGLSLNHFSESDVLEVGCGPYGIIHFIDSRKSVGIDPINFNTWKEFKQDNLVWHLVATGERLPFGDNEFDNCVCFNILDHAIYPKAVMTELDRILKPDGEVLLWVHAIHGYLKIFRPLLSLIDKSHPHHFTYDQVLTLAKEHNFTILSAEKKALGDKGNAAQRFFRNLRISMKTALAHFLVINVFVRLKKS